MIKNTINKNKITKNKSNTSKQNQINYKAYKILTSRTKLLKSKF